MKKLYTFCFLFCFFLSFSQNAEYLGISDLSLAQIGEHQIKANLKVTGSTAGEYLTNKIETSGSQITLSLCYKVTDFGAMTYYDHDFNIGIPTVPSNYNLKVNVYQTEVVCDYKKLEDSVNLNFSMPFSGTISLKTFENDFNNKSVSLFPNPVKDILNFKTDVKFDEVNVYDASGRLVLTSLFKPEINVSNLKNGNYFLELKSKDKIITKKFVVKK
ncbi:Por secretion system C-terminal sorting domain-containing protein [Soonwooa buanensis]|uniref:Por secretion system C-terminal sorting domain-containing protein n=1 Tax=Soonwooa buanensis TaxID=619805 RepID=A0A1T5EVI7_9FLAO|nr:T9SS type A sorting domain-containing protein [Soonwooa buanensis]SKB87982.1 Por secretion system C-terminal sorting domain-containing protein [Soonwooa buanensis]